MQRPAPLNLPDISAILDQIADVDTADGITAMEFADHIGLGIKAARERLRRLIDAGRAEAGGSAHRQAIDGTRRLVPVYRIK